MTILLCWDLKGICGRRAEGGPGLLLQGNYWREWKPEGLGENKCQIQASEGAGRGKEKGGGRVRSAHWLGLEGGESSKDP